MPNLNRGSPNRHNLFLSLCCFFFRVQCINGQNRIQSQPQSPLIVPYHPAVSRAEFTPELKGCPGREKKKKTEPAAFCFRVTDSAVWIDLWRWPKRRWIWGGWDAGWLGMYFWVFLERTAPFPQGWSREIGKQICGNVCHHQQTVSVLVATSPATWRAEAIKLNTKKKNNDLLSNTGGTLLL